MGDFVASFEVNNIPHYAGSCRSVCRVFQIVVFFINPIVERLKIITFFYTRSRIPCLDQSDKQALFSRHFGQGNIYDTPDRRGIAVDLLILFRDIHPKGQSGLWGQILGEQHLYF